jgi:hypothetical protein
VQQQFRCSVLIALTLVPTVGAGVASAQSMGCSSPDRPLVGFAIGRSSPYFDVSPETLDPAGGSVLVGGGWQVGGRADLSIGGPFRVRVEGSSAWWEVERRTYDPTNGQVLSETSEGHVGVRQIGAQIGLRGGRAPVCWYLLAGGGLYSLSFRDDTSRQPGVAITPGMDFPTGARGRLQVEVQLHIITKGQPPVHGSAVLAAALVVGWAYRF